MTRTGVAGRVRRAAERQALHALRYPLAPRYRTHVGTHDGPPTPKGIVVPRLLPAYRLIAGEPRQLETT